MRRTLTLLTPPALLLVLLAACVTPTYDMLLLLPGPGGIIPVGTVFRIQLEAKVDPGAVIVGETIFLHGPDGQVPGRAVIDPDQLHVTFIPDAPLTPDTTYTFHVFQSMSSTQGYILSETVEAEYHTSPVDGGFRHRAQLAYLRFFHTATKLASGEVMLAGGIPRDPDPGLFPLPWSNAEVYDPATGQVRLVEMNAPRFQHTATTLADGRVLLVGGELGPTTEVYDAASDAFVLGPSMVTAGRVGHTATLLADGRVLITGGLRVWLDGLDVVLTPLDSAELIDLAAGTVTALPAMGSTRVGHTATRLTSGRVLIAGGNASTATVLFDPASDSWTAGGALVSSREDHRAALLPDGRVLLVGGSDASGKSLTSAERYDPATSSSTLTGAMAAAREDHTLTRLADGRYLVTGGEDNEAGPKGDVVLQTAERYDPATGSWSPADQLTIQRDDHTATRLDDGSVLIVGGEDENGVGLPLVERYTPGS